MHRNVVRIVGTGTYTHRVYPISTKRRIEVTSCCQANDGEVETQTKCIRSTSSCYNDLSIRLDRYPIAIVVLRIDIDNCHTIRRKCGVKVSVCVIPDNSNVVIRSIVRETNNHDLSVRLDCYGTPAVGASDVGGDHSVGRERGVQIARCGERDKYPDGQ